MSAWPRVLYGPYGVTGCGARGWARRDADGEAADMNDQEAGLDGDEAEAVIKAVSRQLKLWREASGLTQAEFGAAIGYGEEQVSSVERGKRIPRPEYLDGADEALDAGGKISAMKRDLAEARY